MKRLLLIIIFIYSVNLYSQNLPSDSIVLKKIYGKFENDGKSFKHKLNEEELNFSNKDSICYRIVFKERTCINKRNLILTILEANNSFQHGHQFGYRDYYFIEQFENRIEIIDSIISYDEIPIGDKSNFEIADIGKQKKVLISNFQSTGNDHFEKKLNLYLLEIGKITFLLTIHSEYDNSTWNTPDLENEICEAQKYQENFEIEKNDTDWFNIRIHRTDYKFTNGCKESFIMSEFDKVYSYVNGQYEEIKNN